MASNNSRYKVLPRGSYKRPTLRVAKALLGKYLVRRIRSKILAARIVEVEAYVGLEDQASHASRGRTRRNQVMFGAPGMAYVYLIYGMHHCVNVVTERIGYPAAILIRAVELESKLIDGPGRVCRFFQIDRNLNGVDLTAREHMWIEDRGRHVGVGQIIALPRIGVHYAGEEWAEKPWRFRVKGRRPVQATRYTPGTLQDFGVVSEDETGSPPEG